MARLRQSRLVAHSASSLARVARSVDLLYLITLRDRFGWKSSGDPRALEITRSHHVSDEHLGSCTSVAPSLFFPPSRPVFTFPVHWPDLGVDLGLNYCHPLLTTTGPKWVWDLGLDHRHQPLPGSLMKQTSLFMYKRVTASPRCSSADVMLTSTCTRW